MQGVLEKLIVLCVCFVNRCFIFCPLSFGHYAICPDLQILKTSLVSSNSYLLIFFSWLWVSLIKIVQETRPAY